ncbi:MAG: bifunctional phosphopantothenoylcysteine decarboxylase/phosphopantothenate--cysteine ligase CoaBC [Firmicutes bacterium]|nr:bifunctional phosphopantothenoylcysteine decarboxylase/phosphopantothenate--cysteine ligase CoaBC [Bacillota bacterium]
MLQGRRIGLGVSGGIAAYKAVELCSRLRRLGADVQVAMTRNACRLVTPLTFRAISGNPVITGMFREPRRWSVEHVEFARWAELIAVVPATANLIGKVASGIADDFLTTAIMAAKCRVLFAPSMNEAMYENPIVRANISRLKVHGYEFIEPEEGRLACGEFGRGRLPDTGEIVQRIVSILTVGGGRRDLEGVRVVVTAGPTREPIDPVRFLSNPSSGKMGFVVAEEAAERGAHVVLVSGPVSLPPPPGVRLVGVTTAREMYDAVMSELDSCDVLVKTAAVSDYRPESVSGRKIKKSDAPLTLRLVPNPDILREAGKRKGSRILVGFAAETENLVENASAKLREKNLDLIVVNDVSREGAGFGGDTNAAKIVDAAGAVIEVPLTTKRMLARLLLDKVAELLSAKGRSAGRPAGR